MATVLMSPGPIGVGPCPAQLGGPCLALGPPVKLVVNLVADATGDASATPTFPAGAPVGAVVTLQAAAARGAGGVDSDASPPVETVVAP